MLHGNVLLRGWRFGDVSYYTTEIPQYALVEVLRGLNADVVHVAAAMTYTLAVLLAALLANFVVLYPGIPGYAGFTQERAVLATFGTPARTYHLGTYTILVWNKNLLTELR
jgi:hypothetical protein